MSLIYVKIKHRISFSKKVTKIICLYVWQWNRIDLRIFPVDLDEVVAKQICRYNFGQLPFRFLYVCACTIRPPEQSDGGTLLPIQQLIDYKIASFDRDRTPFAGVIYDSVHFDADTNADTRVRDFRAGRVIEIRKRNIEAIARPRAAS